MNKQLAAAGRKMIKDYLAQFPEEQIRRFKLMYGRDGGKRSVADTEAMNIDDVVDQMDEERISLALDQCENTLAINRRKQAGGQ
jgi:hypothetical protein